MIKKACIKEMFVKHFKRTLGPQDNNNEPHPAIAHMYAVDITETMNVLQVNGTSSTAIAQSLSCHDTSRFLLSTIFRMTLE